MALAICINRLSQRLGPRPGFFVPERSALHFLDPEPGRVQRRQEQAGQGTQTIQTNENGWDELVRSLGLDGIGDVAGAPWLAHKASHEGVMVAELIAGQAAFISKA